MAASLMLSPGTPVAPSASQPTAARLALSDGGRHEDWDVTDGLLSRLPSDGVAHGWFT
jgi:hypothetical protein